MTNPPPGPRAKIERAKKHLDDLRGEIAAFHDTDPYTIVREAHPDGGWIARIEPWPPPIPHSIPPIFGDLLHNLRSSLDILVCDLVRDHWPDHLGEWSGFPIVRNAKDLKAKVAEKVKGATNAVQKAIIREKPYKRGNVPLWQLHNLNILDKHRLIIPTVTASHSVNIGDMLRSHMQATGFPVDTLPKPDLWIKPASPCEDEGGIVFRDRTTEAQPDYTMQFQMYISVHEPGLVECEPIIPFASQMVDVVEGVVHGFDPLFS